MGAFRDYEPESKADHGVHGGGRGRDHRRIFADDMIIRGFGWSPDEGWNEPGRGRSMLKWDSKMQKKRQAEEIRKSLFKYKSMEEQVHSSPVRQQRRGSPQRTKIKLSLRGS